MCNEKSILYDNQLWPVPCLDQEEAPKHLPKPNLYKKKKKVLVTVWWSATRLVYYSFLYPCETITSEKYAQQIDEMHQKLQCLQPALVNRKVPILLHNNPWPHVAQAMLQKWKELGHKVLLHLPHWPDLLSSDYHFFKDFDNFFCKENPSTIRRQKMLSKSSSNPKAQVFILQE